jgi:hypothetical protein
MGVTLRGVSLELLDDGQAPWLAECDDIYVFDADGVERETALKDEVDYAASV